MAEKTLKDQAVLLHAVQEAVQQGPAHFATEGQYPILSNVFVGDEEDWVIMSHLINLHFQIHLYKHSEMVMKSMFLQNDI